MAQLRGTLVLLMAVENIRAITDVLLANGKPAGTAAAAVQDGSLSTQRSIVSTLDRLAGDLAEAGLRPPATIVIGDVVAAAQGT